MLNQASSSMPIAYTRYTTYQNLLQRKVNTMFADFSAQKVGKFWVEMLKHVTVFWMTMGKSERRRKSEYKIE